VKIYVALYGSLIVINNLSNFLPLIFRPSFSSKEKVTNFATSNLPNVTSVDRKDKMFEMKMHKK